MMYEFKDKELRDILWNLKNAYDCTNNQKIFPEAVVVRYFINSAIEKIVEKVDASKKTTEARTEA